MLIIFGSEWVKGVCTLCGMCESLVNSFFAPILHAV